MTSPPRAPGSGTPLGGLIQQIKKYARIFWQVDRVAGRIFVNEQQAKKGRWYDTATIEAIGTSTTTNHLDIVSTNPGNGGIALVRAELPIE